MPMPENTTSDPKSAGSVLPQHPNANQGPDFASLLAVCPDAVIVFDADFRILYANPRAIQVSHLRPDGSLGDSYWDIRPDMLGTTLEENFQTAMRTREARRFEYFYPNFKIWVDVQLFPHADGLAALYQDVTASRDAEQTRDASVLQLQQVYAATPDGILIVDRDWNFTFANQHAIDLLKSGPIVGENLWELFPGNRAEPYISNYRRTMEQRSRSDFEAFYPEPLGLWFRSTAQPFGQDGLIIFFSDITMRKAVEERRDDLTQRLDQVLEVTSDCVLSIDHDWRVTFINRRGAETLAGAGNIIGRHFWEHFPDAVFPGSPFVEHYYRAMEERLPSNFEAFYPAPLNAWFDIEAQPAPSGIIIFFRDITADRNAKEALRTSENRYRALTEYNPQLIFTSDSEGRVTFANQSLLDFLGTTTPEPGQSTDWTSAIHPEDRQKITQSWVRSIETGTQYEEQARVLRAVDGQFRWLNITVVPIRDEAEKVQSWLGIAIDVHDQRSATESLAASETRYRILADLNPQFIWMGSPVGQVTYANQRFLEYIGLQHTPDGIENWVNAFDPIDRKRVIQTWSRCVDTGSDYDIDARLIRDADGASRWFCLRASPVRDENGAVLHWLGVAIDIQDSRTFAETLHQKQLETERQRAELESIYEHTPVGLALFDPASFRYLRINDELAKMIGLPKDQIVGRSVLDIASGVATIGELFRQVATGKPIIGHILEGELSSQPGVSRTWNVNYFPVYDKSGTLTGITTASLEITQQKKTEAALIQSEKLAAVGRLASSISHEINNPLEAITNLLYLVALDPNLPPELKVYVTMAQSELSRVSQIATQTLRFHRQAVRPTSVTAAQLVDAVLNLYQGRLANSGIRVLPSYSTSAQILCFENDIRQVLNNLIANAIDAMRGGGQLLVRAHNTTDRPTGRRGIRITIADTGHGMSSSTLTHLFEPFYTTKGLNGTGLGLWISDGIVQRHKGRLQVRSTQHPVHHGTIFSLFLPSSPD